MRSGAGLHADQARLQPGRELQHLAVLQLPTNDNLAGITDRVYMEHRLRDTQSDRAKTPPWAAPLVRPQHIAT